MAKLKGNRLTVLNYIAHAGASSGAEIASNTISIPTTSIYKILSRMEKAGWLKSHLKKIPGERNRPRRLYEITDFGMSALKFALEEQSQFRNDQQKLSTKIKKQEHAKKSDEPLPDEYVPSELDPLYKEFGRLTEKLENQDVKNSDYEEFKKEIVIMIVSEFPPHLEEISNCIDHSKGSTTISLNDKQMKLYQDIIFECHIRLLYWAEALFGTKEIKKSEELLPNKPVESAFEQKIMKYRKMIAKLEALDINNYDYEEFKKEVTFMIASSKLPPHLEEVHNFFNYQDGGVTISVNDEDMDIYNSVVIECCNQLIYRTEEIFGVKELKENQLNNQKLA